MKNNRITFNGRTLFILALFAIELTFLTVYLTGINYNRTLSSNFYISLIIISLVSISFLWVGLYKGTQLINNYPKLANYKPGKILDIVSMPPFIDGGDGIGGILAGILLWIVMAIAMVILLLLFEAVFWASIFVIFSTLYWLFFRALRLVFIHAKQTRGHLWASGFIALKYTITYTGWLFGIALAVQQLR